MAFLGNGCWDCRERVEWGQGEQGDHCKRVVALLAFEWTSIANCPVVTVVQIHHFRLKSKPSAYTPKRESRCLMALEKEIATYLEKKCELLANEGKFALIHGDELAGIWDTYEDALKVGYEKYGLAPFLVKKIEAVEAVNYYMRHVPCRS
jgi:hypothetical protein